MNLIGSNIWTGLPD